MAAGVPDIGGLQQHHKKEQGTLRYDRRGGAEAKKATEETVIRTLENGVSPI